MKYFLVSLLALFISAGTISAEVKIITANSICLHGTPKYPADFQHFDYINPNAPVGGILSQATTGTYDNFNRYALRGNPAVNSSSLYDSLMTTSMDEPQTFYALIAEKIEYPEDYSWVIFHINPKAKFQDGKPITADDVLFSYNKFFNEGVPQFKKAYSAFVLKIEVLDKYRIKFTLKVKIKENIVNLCSLSILPKQFWSSHKLGDPLTVVPLGSSGFTIKDYKMGEYVVYQRLADYWGLNLPVNIGQMNFDRIRYDYYRDLTVAFEAFKAGEFDIWQEGTAKNWATMYTGPQFDAKSIIKDEITNQIPKGMQGFFFNVTRPVLSDRKVRMAITYALDFEWMNHNLFYNQYTRLRSYFTGTAYEAKGLPDAAELKILTPLKGKIPDEVFTKEYNPPSTDGSGNIRKGIVEALKLFKEAGWEIKNEKLVNVKTGTPMEIELILDDQSYERIAIPFQKNLEKMGILLTVRTLDDSQFLNRWHNRDYDMVMSTDLPVYYPDSDLKEVWRSDYIDSTYNTPGVQDKAVDVLIDGIISNQDNEKTLLAYGHALDRVLTWNAYTVPHWYLNKFRVAYWNKFSRPGITPKYGLGLDTWWVDTVKEAKLPKRNQKN